MIQQIAPDCYILNDYEFNKAAIGQIDRNLFVSESWPVVYLIINRVIKEIYIGETTYASSRMQSHLANEEREQLDRLYIIGSDKFNKSVTLDLESYLIKYIHGDGIFTLQNGNGGLSNHNYFLKSQYYKVFEKVWLDLQEKKITKHSLTHIDNTNLFKYSPYKSLSKDQEEAIGYIVQNLVSKKNKTIIVEGGAGTGKTVLATFLMKLLKTEMIEVEDETPEEEESVFVKYIELLTKKFEGCSIALVVPVTSLRKTLKKVLRTVKGLNQQMVIGPSEVFHKEYDILLVDEAHRLKRRKAITGYETFDKNNLRLGLGNEGTELDWIISNSKHQILFYDKGQSVKPSDVPEQYFDKLKALSTTKIVPLVSQLRVKGGIDYINFIERLFDCNLENTGVFNSPQYELKLFDNLQKMVDQIKGKDKELGLSRLIGGFAWPWKSKNLENRKAFDIVIDGTKLRWNSEAADWTNSENAPNEVGCIHTTQGYDLNYAGVIFGKEIFYDKINNQIRINKKEYQDIKGKEGANDAELHDYILNIYRTIMFRAIRGTYVFVCDKELREYFKRYIQQV